MDDINAKPTIEKIRGKCGDDYHECQIYSGWVDKLDNNCHMYISGSGDNGHTSTTIDHIKKLHEILGEFIEKYDKEQARIDAERVVVENCLDCDAHTIIKDPDPTDWFNDDDVAVVCTLKDNDEVKKDSRYMSDMCIYKSITRSCRPHKARKESNVPKWCPKDYYKYIKREPIKDEENG